MRVVGREYQMHIFSNIPKPGDMSSEPFAMRRWDGTPKYNPGMGLV